MTDLACRYPAPALALLAEQLEASGALWVVGGSTGLAIRGADIGRPPRDLDLYADAADIPAIHASLAAYAVDEPAESTTGRYRSILSHYVIADTAVELVGNFEVRKGGSRYRSEVRDALYPLGESRIPAGAGGRAVRLVPLGHELIFNVLRDRPDRCRIVGDLIRSDPGLHLPVLQALKDRNVLSAEDAAAIDRFAGAADSGYRSGGEHGHAQSDV